MLDERMNSGDPKEPRKVDRRTFVKGGLLAGGVAAGAGVAIKAVTDGSKKTSATKAGSTGSTQPATEPSSTARRRRPNILVIVVDQMRFPQWFGAGPGGLQLPPNIRSISDGGVSFARHYTASNDCTPSRAALLTGLHAHQTGALITGGSTLDPGLPTWGTMLREQGYHTRWLGKWHLTRRDNHWTATAGERALQRYGFAGGIYPSPDGGAGQGWHTDPEIANAFAHWFKHEGGAEPWCTTVSFVNPHDIAWWYAWSTRVPAEASVPHYIQQLPPNFETPEQLQERRKPRLQLSLQDTAAASFGTVPFSGPGFVHKWLAFLDLYVELEREVDRHVGQVLRTLESRPEVAANTVIIFTSDHGEYAASHGLRGKGAGAYEEAIRIPLIVKDPRGVLTTATGQLRNQLTSSVDIAPLLLTIASGSSQWRREAHYSQIANRLDLAHILAEPSAPGRPYVLHTTDEIVTEFAIKLYASDAPLHVLAMRTATAKLATYSDWPAESLTPLPEEQEIELYDYSSQAGRLELDNVAGHSDLEGPMLAELARAAREELHAPLPYRLQAAQQRGYQDYYNVAQADAKAALIRRKGRSERDIGPVDKIEGPEA
jgi:arylsulfatase A-like enzyme